MATRRARLKPSKTGGFRGGKKARKALAKANQEIQDVGYSSNSYRGMMAAEPPDRGGIPAYTQKTNIPLFISDPKLAPKVYELIQQGNYISTVCKAVGIHKTTFMQWLRRGFEGVDLAHYDFYMNVRKADGLAEADRVEQIVKHGHFKWQANAWMLERRYPDTWGKRETVHINQRTQQDVNISVKQELAEKVIEDTESRSLARQLITRKRSDS